MKLRSQLAHSVPKKGTEIFAKGKTISREAGALLAQFAEKRRDGTTRYDIGCSEVRDREWWCLTIVVDSRTKVIQNCDYFWEKEKESGRCPGT